MADITALHATLDASGFEAGAARVDAASRRASHASRSLTRNLRSQTTATSATVAASNNATTALAAQAAAASSTSTATAAAATSAQTASTQYNELGRSMGYARRAAIGLFAAMAGSAVIGVATSKALSFRDAMNEVSTLVDTNVTDMRELEAGVRRIAVTYGQDMITTAKGLYQIISAGIPAGDAVNFLEVSAKTAVAGVTDIKTAADALTSSVKAYSDEAQNAEQYSDALFVAMRAGKTTISELSATVGMLAPEAAAAGIAFDELYAAVSALTTIGLSTQMAGTGVRRLIDLIKTPTALTRKAVKEFQMDYFSSNALRELGLEEIIKRFIRDIDNNPNLIPKFFQGVSARRVVTAFTGGAGESFSAINEQMRNKAGETTLAFTKMDQAGTMVQARKAASEYNDTMIKLGDTVKKFVLPALVLLANNLERIIQVTIKVGSALVVAFSPLLVGAVVALTAAMGKMVATVIALNLAMLKNPFVLAASGMVAAYTAYQALIKPNSEADMFITKSETLMWFWRDISQFIGNAVDKATQLPGINLLTGAESTQSYADVRRAARRGTEAVGLQTPEEVEDWLAGLSEDANFQATANALGASTRLARTNAMKRLSRARQATAGTQANEEYLKGVEKSLDRLVKKINPVFALQKKFNDDMRDLEKAAANGDLLVRRTGFTFEQAVAALRAKLEEDIARATAKDSQPSQTASSVTALVGSLFPEEAIKLETANRMALVSQAVAEGVDLGMSQEALIAAIKADEKAQLAGLTPPDDTAQQLQATMDRLQPLQALVRNLNTELQLLQSSYESGKLSADEYSLSVELLRQEFEKNADEVTGAAAALQKQQQQYNAQPLVQYTRSLQDMSNVIQSTAVTAIRSLSDGMARAILQAQSFRDVMANVLQQVAQALMSFAIQYAVVAPILTALGFGLAAAPAAAGAGVANLPAVAADGMVLSNGRQLTAFAAGGIVSKPTLFPMANGAGLMGEAGPEAIMPLKRGPDGKLGVSGGSGTTVYYEGDVNITIEGDASEATAQKIAQQISLARSVAREEMVEQQKPGGLLNRSGSGNRFRV